MLLDIIFLVLMVFAIVKGYRRGLIVGLFSILAIIVGLAAAMKLSTVVAGYLEHSVNISHRWLPFVSFLVVFIIIVLLVHLGANLLQKAVEMIMLGWVNRIGGIILYALMYTIIYSILVFYAKQLKLIQEETITNSICYTFIQPFGPWAINGFGNLIPFFKDMFAELSDFFQGVAEKAPTK